MFDFIDSHLHCCPPEIINKCKCNCNSNIKKEVIVTVHSQYVMGRDIGMLGLVSRVYHALPRRLSRAPAASFESATPLTRRQPGWFDRPAKTGKPGLQHDAPPWAERAGVELPAGGITK